MRKIDRVLVAIGGKGRRAKCEELGIPSKCFFKIAGETLLEIIMRYLAECVPNVVVDLVVTTKTQEDAAHICLQEKGFRYRVVYNDQNDVFHMVHSGENTVIVFGDTYFPSGNIIAPMVDAFIGSGCSQFMLLKTDCGIDNVVFHIEKNTNLIKSVCEGPQVDEATQVFVLSGNDCAVIEQNIEKSDRFTVIYHNIMKKSPCYAHFGDCININMPEQWQQLGLEI